MQKDCEAETWLGRHGEILTREGKRGEGKGAWTKDREAGEMAQKAKAFAYTYTEPPNLGSSPGPPHGRGKS